MVEFTQSIEVHYPTTVMQRHFARTGELNEKLLSVLQSLSKQFADTPQNAVSSGLISTQGGYQTATDVNLFTLKFESITQFRDEMVLPAARDYLFHVFGDQAAQFNPWPDGWATLLKKGDWQRPHFHPTQRNVVCGVYYVKLPESMPEPEGNIEFFNPIQVSVNHGFPSTRRLVPREGTMILFPPWYIHYVYPFSSDGDRAIIAFDILAQKPGGRFVS